MSDDKWDSSERDEQEEFSDDEMTDIDDDAPPDEEFEADESETSASEEDEGGVASLAPSSDRLAHQSTQKQAVRQAIDRLPDDVQLEVTKIMQGFDYDNELWEPIAAMSVIAAHFAKESRAQSMKAADLDKRSAVIHKQLKETQKTIDQLPNKVESRIANIEKKIEDALDAKMKEVLTSWGKHATNRLQEEQKTLRGLIEGAWDRSINEVASEGSLKLFRVFSKPMMIILSVPLLIGLVVGLLLALGLSA